MKKMKRKMKSLTEIYKQTHPIQEKTSVDFEEERLSPLVKDIECPTLSPPPPNTVNTVEIPSNSSSSSEMSSIHSILSPSTERQVCEAQGRIEEEVYSIARANGLTLDGEAPHVLGQWVHGEASNLSTLHSILEDLQKQKEKSEWFESAADVWSQQFLVQSPAEEFHALVYSSFSLCFCLLLLVLLLLYFVTKKKKGGEK
jgi:hypothetical protein